MSQVKLTTEQVAAFLFLDPENGRAVGRRSGCDVFASLKEAVLDLGADITIIESLDTYYMVSPTSQQFWYMNEVGCEFVRQHDISDTDFPEPKTANDVHCFHQESVSSPRGNSRWENGLAHHPVARAIYDLLSKADWECGNDHFGWKAGGDGDNGETLMFALSELMERNPAVLCDLRNVLDAQAAE